MSANKVPLVVTWLDATGQPQQALWRSISGVPPHDRIALADDRMSADAAYKLVCEGTALLWQGDFHQAKQLLQALARRIDRTFDRKPEKPAANITLAFHQHRQRQAQRAKLLGMVLLPFEADHTIALRRAPHVQTPCAEVWGPGDMPYVASLRELQGLIGAHEWRKAGVLIPALRAHIHAHHGVFSPVRGEYIDLVAQAPLPKNTSLAFDIGVGTGVLSAVLARRGVQQVVATDQDPRALACARDNVQRLGLSGRIELLQTDLFPAGHAPLVVCNPPWVPAQPSSPIEHAIYDPDSRMLKGFLSGVRDHLSEGGQAWLILSDLAEHLGLRTRQQLLGWIAQAGLQVHHRMDARPLHRKAQDRTDPLHAARSAEVTSLWCLMSAGEHGCSAATMRPYLTPLPHDLLRH
jgi:methylase of polypeptide subunit release factors